MTIDINELRRLAKAATPPQGWYVQLGDYIYGCKDATDGEEWQPVIANTEGGEPVNFEGSVAAFIAAASPTSILELLDRLEAAEKERDTLRNDLLAVLKEYWNQDQNEAAMSDACWHVINTARIRVQGEKK